MKLQFSVNLNDADGDVYDECIMLFIGKRASIRFKNLRELHDFAHEIECSIIPEIVENCFDELSASDQAEFGGHYEIKVTATFNRGDDPSNEICLSCKRHIRDHYGGTEYRCYPKE